jgi:hypothetical protein
VEDETGRVGARFADWQASQEHAHVASVASSGSLAAWAPWSELEVGHLRSVCQSVVMCWSICKAVVRACGERYVEFAVLSWL